MQRKLRFAHGLAVRLGTAGGAGGRAKPKSAWRLLVALLVCLIAVSGCARSTGGITLAGSTSVQPFADMLAEEYMTLHPTEHVNVQGGGSSAGIEAALSGAAQIGMSSRDLKGDETKLVRIEIARDAIAVVVHPSNPVRDLSLEQVRGIFSGKVRRWSEVGGPDRPIVVVTREEGSGTRSAFQDLVLSANVAVDPGALVQDSNGAVRQLVSNDPSAVGYVSLGLVNEQVKSVSLDGVQATTANIQAGKYKLVRPFLFVLKAEPEGSTKAFIDYVLGADGQKSLAHEGLLGPSSKR
jgi:phosphate transport system substrate-binding protein